MRSRRKAGPVLLGTGRLTIEDIVDVARRGRRVERLSATSAHASVRRAFAAVEKSRRVIDEVVERNDGSTDDRVAYYGINTGFGSKAGRHALPNEDIPLLSRNLILSHAAGMGAWLDIEVVRAAMLIRANSLSLGLSGVRSALVNTLIDMLNRDVVPAVPSYGSVGASGDLAPLSHLAQVLSSSGNASATADDYDESGQAFVPVSDTRAEGSQIVAANGSRYVLTSGANAMKLRRVRRLKLLAKEGLALNNGATFSAAIGALAVYDAENIARHAEIGTAMAVDATLGFRDAFLPWVQSARRHQGQVEVADRVIRFLRGSNLADGDADRNPRVVPPQDDYSIRATPPVLGSVWESLHFIRQTVSNEVNAVTDNPLILELPRSYKAVSGANFHGAPLAHALDFLAIVMTDLGSLLERRVFKLVDPKLNEGLPGFLVPDPINKPGITSGLMIAQYLAAGLVSDCKTLAHPDSVDSIPTSANREDHVSMSMNAARHARTVVENIGRVAAIELLCSFLAVECRLESVASTLRAGTELPSDEDDWKRADWLVKDLRARRINAPAAGRGSQAAIARIDRTLHAAPQGLPRWGKDERGRPDAHDRYLRPYLLRMEQLLASQEVVRDVYTTTKLTLPDGLR